VFSHSKRCPMCRAEYNSAMLMNDKMYFPTEYIPVISADATYSYGSEFSFVLAVPLHFYSTLAIIIIWKETLVKACYYLAIFYFYYQCMIILCGIFTYMIE
jgi:hypothetical protein